MNDVFGKRIIGGNEARTQDDAVEMGLDSTAALRDETIEFWDNEEAEFWELQRS